MSQFKIQQTIQSLIPSTIRTMQAYHVSDASGLIKLDAMENPYAWDVSLKKVWLDRIASAAINRYPDPQAQGIKQRLRTQLSLQQGTEILLGNGSDELIQLIIMAVAASGRVIMAPSPSFVMYKTIADYLAVPFSDVPLNADFSLNQTRMINAIKEQQPAVIFLATPNNPTANVFSNKNIEEIIQTSTGLVVLDEAYTAFTASDQLHWLERYPNVLIMRTFSKIGLAGLRLGFLCGARAWLQELDKLRLPYNINVLSQISVEFALDHFAVFQKQSELLCEQRAELFTCLEKMQMFECFSSEANFITVRCLQHNAHDIFQKLKSQGVLIKCLHGGHPLLDQCLRITVGTPEENKVLLDTLYAVTQ